MSELEKPRKFGYGPAPSRRLTIHQKMEIDRKRDEWLDKLIRYYQFSDTRSLSYDLKKGEIYEVDWGMNINAEFSGRHFGVVLADSGPQNPLVFICPLKTNHKKIVNPHSDIFLGVVDGLPEGKNTVAVLNQARAIDKMRIFTKLAIGPDNYNFRSRDADGEEYEIKRLDDKRVQKIVSGVARLVFGLPLKEAKIEQSGEND